MTIIERNLHWMSRVYPFFNYAALRYFNAAGASEQRGEDHTLELHLIPLVLQVALGRDKIYMFGDDYEMTRRHLHPRLHPRPSAGAYPYNDLTVTSTCHR